MPDWLDIPDPELDARHIMGQVENRLAEHPAGDGDPVAVMVALRREMLGGEGEAGGPTAAAPLPSAQEADIVPRAYKIDWRNPILGPLNALLRRFVNLELRRSIYPALEQQSALNRQMLAELRRLRAENAALRRQLDARREEDA